MSPSGLLCESNVVQMIADDKNLSASSIETVDWRSVFSLYLSLSTLADKPHSATRFHFGFLNFDVGTGDSLVCLKTSGNKLPIGRESWIFGNLTSS